MVDFEKAFAKLPPSKQNRFEDRMSFLYLEHRKIIQDEFGVVALGKTEEDNIVERLQIPVGGLAFLALGPGTSITNAAVTSATRYGCVVGFTTGGALTANSVITPLSSSSKWLLAQAAVVSDETKARKVAKKFYSKQFGVDSFSGSIAQMRAIEGTLMKKAYAAEARKYKISHFRRNTKGLDNVNIALNICNSILYGISAAAVGAMGMSQGLGVIHRGNPGSLLFDLADFYKPSLVIPLAFSLHSEDPEEVPSLARRKLRGALQRKAILADLINTLQYCFNDYLPKNEDDRLIGLQGEVEGHKNYSDYRGNHLANKITEEIDAFDSED